MKIFKFRKKRQVDNQAVSHDEQPIKVLDQSKISRELFVNDEQPEEDDYPIYAIYNSLNRDMETEGYKEAKEYADSSYCSSRQQLIVYNLKLEIQRAYSRYQDMLLECDSKITVFTNMGLVEILRQKEYEKQKLNRHIDQLKEIEKDVQENGERIKPLLESYQRGFQRGLVERLNNSNNVR